MPMAERAIYSGGESESHHVDTTRAVFDASAGGYVRFVGTEISAATEVRSIDHCWRRSSSLLADAPPGRVAELRRVVAPCGYTLLAFQAGNDEALSSPAAHGTEFPLTSYRHDPSHVAHVLGGSGSRVHSQLLREPRFTHESSPQAFIIARRQLSAG